MMRESAFWFGLLLVLVSVGGLVFCVVSWVSA